MDKATIAEIRAYTKPHALVLMAMEATMILLGQQETNWMAAKKLMAKIEFKKNVRELDPEDIPAPMVDLLVEKYLLNP